VPGDFLKDYWQELRPSAVRGPYAAVCIRPLLRRSAYIRVASAALGLAWCSLTCVRADEARALAISPLPVAPVTAAPVVHLTDAQDRLGNGKLKSLAERRSRANVLYAQALLLPDDEAGDRQTAIDLLRQVTDLDPAFEDAQVKLANLLLESGQFDDALARLEKAAAAHPDSIPIEVALGYTQKLRGQTEQALRYCRRALAVDPNQAPAMRVILEIAADQEDLAGGVIHVEDILKANGSDVPASAWLNLARLYLEVARSEVHPEQDDVLLRTRLPILQEAAAKSPPSVETLSLLADTYRNLGRKAEALKTFQRAAALEPGNVDILLHRADLETDLGRKADALKDYEDAYAINSDLPGLREMLGGLYLDSRRYDDAARLFEEALSSGPANPEMEIDLGIAYEESHHPDKAQACFQRVFDAVACPPEAYLKLAFYQLQHQEVKEAGQTLASAQAHFPQSARIRFYQAVQHRYEKNYPAALDSLAQVRALAVGTEASALDPYYYLENAETLELVGKNTELEAVLHEGLTRYPDNPELMNELAYFWADHSSHLPEALALSRRAAELEPDNGPILDTWGWVYFQMGQAKDALPYLQRAAFMTNNDPVVLQHVGDAYLKLGLRREAIATWTRALEKDPRNGDLTNRIDAAQAQAKNVHSRSAPNP
jgi:tetratricopeptide (TPR) repeat protein